MSYSTYSAFRSAVLRMIDGDDAGSSLSTETLDLLISFGESRVYLGDATVPGLRAASMEKPLSLTVTDNLASLPADCLALSIVLADGKPLDYVPEHDALRLMYSGGTPRHYSQQGASLTFHPPASGTVAGRYYARPAPLKTALPAVFTQYPECFLFAALAEAAPFIGEDSRLPMWKQLWTDWMRSASNTERQRSTHGARLTIRSR